MYVSLVYISIKISTKQRNQQIFQKIKEMMNSDKIAKGTTITSYENRKGEKLGRGEKPKWKSFDAAGAIVVRIL